MNSPEGLGRARHRWREYQRSIPDDVQDSAYGGLASISDFAEELRPKLGQVVTEELKAVRERSELIGFWVTWHLAGGFENLEDAGWHRATIFRKVKRFREHYGAHPDEYEFSWLKLDAERYWFDELCEYLDLKPEPRSQ